MDDPFLDEGMTRWIRKTAAKNHWRVASWYDLEDLIADGYLCYYKCKERYGARVEAKPIPFSRKKKWMMQLVSSAFRKHITTLAKRASAVPEQPMSAFTEQIDWGNCVNQEEHATMAALLANAPKEITEVLNVLLNDTHEYMRTGRLSVRETTDQLIQRVLGVSSGRKVLANYFIGE